MRANDVATTPGKLSIIRCATDGSGCTSVDVSQGKAAYRGSAPRVAVYLLRGRVIIPSEPGPNIGLPHVVTMGLSYAP